MNALNALFMCIRSVFLTLLDIKIHAGGLMRKTHITLHTTDLVNLVLEFKSCVFKSGSMIIQPRTGTLKKYRSSTPDHINQHICKMGLASFL